MKNSTYFIIVVTVLVGLNGVAVADFDPDQLIDAVDLFLIRQMEYFDLIRPPSQPPLVQTFGWNTNLPFPPPELNPPPCPNHPCAPVPLWQMAYRGDTYDQSLAAFWFTGRAWLDFVNGRDGRENFARAQSLLDALVFLEDHDPYADGRLRAAYWANNLLDPSGTEASIMDPDAGTGNIAWFGIALTRFCDVAQKTDYLDPPTIQHYVDIASEKANWILGHCSDENWPCGFTGGYGGWEQTPFTWKSTEHNIDVYVFARNLYKLDCNPNWMEMAERARCFLAHIYVPLNGQCGYYLGGSLGDGITPNPSPVPTDAQTWTVLARIDANDRAECALRWMLDANNKLLADCCGCLQNGCCYGVAFSNEGKNVQTEVTAGAAMALCLTGWHEDANCLLNCLDWIWRTGAPGYDGIEDGIGLVATPCLEGAYSGYGNAWYYKLLHVASSVWTGLAAMVCQSEVTANPLMPLPDNRTPIADAGGDQTFYAGIDCTVEVPLDGSDSNDPDGDQLAYTWTWTIDSNELITTGVMPTIELPGGVHTIELVVNDGCQDSDPDYVVITVNDNTPPELTVSVTPDILWPPNHKMVLITPNWTVTDNCDESPEVSLISITMNEDDAKGDGHTADDIQIDPDSSIYLRAERSGTENGRVYTITYQGIDDSGNVAVQSATVTVPHDQD